MPYWPAIRCSLKRSHAHRDTVTRAQKLYRSAQALFHGRAQQGTLANPRVIGILASAVHEPLTAMANDAPPTTPCPAAYPRSPQPPQVYRLPRDKLHHRRRKTDQRASILPRPL